MAAVAAAGFGTVAAVATGGGAAGIAAASVAAFAVGPAAGVEAGGAGGATGMAFVAIAGTAGFAVWEVSVLISCFAMDALDVAGINVFGAASGGVDFPPMGRCGCPSSSVFAYQDGFQFAYHNA